MKIMLIDDDIGIVESLKFVFEPAGHECKLFTNPKKAIKAFKSDDYDVIITDYSMPEMTGIDVLKQVRKLSNQAPVIFISGYSDIEYAIGALNYGATAFFRKPFVIKDIMNVLVKIESEVIAQRDRKNAYLQLKKELEIYNSKGKDVLQLLDQLYLS